MSNEETLTQTTTNAADIRRQKLNQTFDELKDAFKEGKNIEVEVIEEIKGGFKTQYKELNIFLPISLYSSKRKLTQDEISAIIGSKLKVKVIEFVEDELTRVVKVSHRSVIEEEQWKGIAVGSTVEGKVKSIVKHGLVLDVNGIDAFAHISNLSKQRINDINSFAKLDDVFKCEVLTIEKENRRMTLSLKNLPNVHYENFFDKCKIGDKVTGKVRSVIGAGVFFEISPNVTGFLKVSEVSWTRREVDLATMFAIGKEFETEIIELNREDSKIGLSYKRLQPDNWQEVTEKYEVGHIYSAMVELIPPNGSGAVVSLNNEIDGFLPKQRMVALYNGNKPTFKKHDELQVKLIEKDAEKHLLLFESTVKPENPYLSLNEDSNENYKQRDKTHVATATSKPTTINNYSLGDLLSDSSKKNLKANR